MQDLANTAAHGPIRFDYVAVGVAMFLDLLLFVFAPALRNRFLRFGTWRAFGPAGEQKAGERFLLILRTAAVLSLLLLCIVFYVLHTNPPSHRRYN